MCCRRGDTRRFYLISFDSVAFDSIESLEIRVLLKQSLLLLEFGLLI